MFWDCLCFFSVSQLLSENTFKPWQHIK